MISLENQARDHYKFGGLMFPHEWVKDLFSTIDDLRAQLAKIMLNVPLTTFAFDGNVPLYVQNAFDNQQFQIERLTFEMDNQRKRADLLEMAFREAQDNEDKMLVELAHLRTQKDYLFNELKQAQEINKC